MELNIPQTSNIVLRLAGSCVYYFYSYILRILIHYIKTNGFSKSLQFNFSNVRMDMSHKTVFSCYLLIWFGTSWRPDVPAIVKSLGLFLQAFLAGSNDRNPD